MPTTPPRRSRRPIRPRRSPLVSPELRRRLNRALVVDFEGPGSSPAAPRRRPQPVLLGVHGPEGYAAFVLDPALHPLASGRRTQAARIVRRARPASLESALEQLLDRAESEDRAVACFSWHERQVVAEHLGEDHPLTRRLAERVLDVKDLLDRARGRGELPSPRERSLRAYAITLLGATPPVAPGRGVGDTITRLRQGVGAAAEWTACPESVRRRWHELLEYNRADCVVTRTVGRVACDRGSRRGSP